MSAKSARRLLERLLCDRAFLGRLSALPPTQLAFAELTATEGYACSLAEVKDAAGGSIQDAVPAELWFRELVRAARSA